MIEINFRSQVMHVWGDPDVDWEGINKAAEFIGKNLRRWGRVDVRDWKEKFGTVRVYCGFSFSQIHSITHPGFCFYQYPKWLWNIDCKFGYHIVKPLNWLFVPYQILLYKILYNLAVEKWPHLRKEILSCADYPELLKNV
jgi:hypothetical protein